MLCVGALTSASAHNAGMAVVLGVGSARGGGRFQGGSALPCDAAIGPVCCLYLRPSSKRASESELWRLLGAACLLGSICCWSQEFSSVAQVILRSRRLELDRLTPVGGFAFVCGGGGPRFERGARLASGATSAHR